MLFRELGFDCKIINYVSKKETVIKNLSSFSKNYDFSFLKKTVYFVLKYFEETYKNIIFNHERKKILNLTKKYGDGEEMKKDFYNCILCSGGDQLWGYMPYNDLDFAYYFNFADPSNTLISLSSSFGRYDFDDKIKHEIRGYLKRYRFITVREKSAVNFLKTLNINSNLILDPTLLISKKEFFKLIDKHKESNDFVLVYKLRRNNQLDELAKKIANKFKIKTIYITNSIFYKNLYGKAKVNPKVSRLLALFRDSRFVISDSFHATVLAIIFNKNFYSYLPGKTNSRIVDLLNMLGLSDRYFDDSSDISTFNFCDNIDYSKINELINDLRKSHINLLNEKLRNFLF